MYVMVSQSIYVSFKFYQSRIIFWTILYQILKTPPNESDRLAEHEGLKGLICSAAPLQ